MNLRILILIWVAWSIHGVGFSQSPSGSSRSSEPAPVELLDGTILGIEAPVELLAPWAIESEQTPTAKARNRVYFKPVPNSNREYAPLKILHVPFGAWLEIEGSWYLHSTTDNTKNVLARIDLSQFHSQGSLMPSIIIRTGSSPREIRLGETGASREVTLVPHQTVEFDYMREFGDRIGAAHASTKPSARPTAYVNTMHAYPSKTDHGYRGDGYMGDGYALASTSDLIEAETFASKILLQWDSNAKHYNSTPNDIPLLQLRGSSARLASLTQSCVMRADVYFKLTAGSGETRFESIEIPLSLGNGVVLASAPDQAIVQGIAADVQKLFNGSNEFAKFLHGLKEDASFQCTFSNLRIEFNNGKISPKPTSQDQLVPGFLLMHIDIKKSVAQP